MRKVRKLLLLLAIICVFIASTYSWCSIYIYLQRFNWKKDLNSMYQASCCIIGLLTHTYRRFLRPVPAPTCIPAARPGRCPRWGRGWRCRRSRSGGSPLGPGSRSELLTRPTATPGRCFRCWEPSGPGWMKPRCCSLQTDCSLCSDTRQRQPERRTRPTWPPAAGAKQEMVHRKVTLKSKIMK